MSETCKIERKLLLFTHTNIGFLLGPKLMTLNGVMAIILRYFAEFRAYR